MKIGLIAMSGVRVKTQELAELGVTLPQFVDRGKVIASLPSLGLLTVAGNRPERCGGGLAEVDRGFPCGPVATPLRGFALRCVRRYSLCSAAI